MTQVSAWVRSCGTVKTVPYRGRCGNDESAHDVGIGHHGALVWGMSKPLPYAPPLHSSLFIIPAPSLRRRASRFRVIARPVTDVTGRGNPRPPFPFTSSLFTIHSSLFTFHFYRPSPAPWPPCVKGAPRSGGGLSASPVPSLLHYSLLPLTYPYPRPNVPRRGSQNSGRRGGAHVHHTKSPHSARWSSSPTACHALPEALCRRRSSRVTPQAESTES